VKTYLNIFISLLSVFLLNIREPLLAAPVAIDPIKFSMSTTASNIALNEEFDITVKASYLNIPTNTAFIFEGANTFRLKLILPEGFVKTGGTFFDFVGAELSTSNPIVNYTLRGKFTAVVGDGTFQLLRSHRNADNNSDFVQVSTISFKVEVSSTSPAENVASRIAIEPSLGHIPHLTIADLRAGLANTAEAVYITDPGRHGIFRYNENSTLPDDGAMTINANGRPYERIYDGTVNVNWFGIVADGATDQSSLIQSLLNNGNYRKLHFPKSNASYRIKSIRVSSGRTLTFEEGTIVEGMGNLGMTERMIYIYDASDIVIRGYNVTFKDHRNNYTTGQHRHIFSLEGVSNAVIEGISANDSGGDGFYLGGASVKKYCENVKLINVQAKNNRRQGISVVSGKNIDIINAIISETNGNAPASGIDLEPGLADHVLEGIRIENPRTFANAGPGIIISPGALAGTGKVIDIVVSNHIDDGSAYGMLVTTVSGILPGSINIENPTWKNSKLNAFVARNWGSRACAVEVINPTVINSNANKSTSPTAGAAFLIYRDAIDSGDTNIGNIHILRPKIMETRNPQTIPYGFSFRDFASSNRIVNCSVIDPVRGSTNYLGKMTINNAEVVVTDAYNTIAVDFGAYDKPLSNAYYVPLYHNQTSTALRTVKMEKVNANFPQVTIEVRAPHAIKILPHFSDNIVPMSPINGKYLTSNVVGSRIVLHKSTANSWFIKEMSGVWTIEP
jgi:hypothetical protein